MSFISDLITGLDSVVPGVSVVEGIWAQLANPKMWRSLGWLFLGILLMLLGAAWWIGPSAARQSPVAVAANRLG